MIDNSVNEVLLQQKDSTSQQNINSTYLCDGKSLVDYVMVYKIANDEKLTKGRKNFEFNLRARGLKLEIRKSEEDPDLCFTLVHAPFNILLRQAEILYLRMPVRKNDLTLSEKDQGIVNYFLQYLKFMKLDKNIKHRLHEEMYFKETFRQSRLVHFVNHDKPDIFFSKSDRSRMVYDLLIRTHYKCDDQVHVGVQRLQESGGYLSVFPPHEKLIKTPCYPIPIDDASDRQILYDNWASFTKFYKHQPLDLIKEYFGTKIGIYFAWLGYFTKLLFWPALIGPLFMIYGIVTAKNDIPSNDICYESSNISLTYICPPCDTYCDYTQLKDSCLYGKITYIVDNFSTAIFAFIMSIWATLFLEGWKRYNARISYKWGIYNQGIEHETIRPDFQYKVKNKRVNPITKELEPFMPTSLKLFKLFFSGVSFLFIVALALAFILGILVYRMILMSTFHSYEKTDFRHKYGMWIIYVTTAIMNLLFIIIMNLVYHKVAYRLTIWECPRTDSGFDNSYTLKVFLFEFVNNYSSLFYIAFVKGRFSGVPGNIDREFRISINGYRVENCDATGCMAELMIQLFVIMCGSQLSYSLIELITPYICININKYKKFMDSTHKNFHRKVSDKDNIPQYEQDYGLYQVDNLFLFDEYLEMIIQYGFVTLFVAAFPLAPLFAFLSNIFEIRSDGRKLISMYQKPTPFHSSNIGMWQVILEYLSSIAVTINGLVIAFTTDVIPKSYYYYTRGSLEGYMEYSLSYADTSKWDKVTIYTNVSMCRFKDFRKPPCSLNITDTNGDCDNHYGYSYEFWKILAFKIIFVFIFERIVSSIQSFTSYIIPDVPESITMLQQRQRYLRRRSILESWAKEHKDAFDVSIEIDDDTDNNSTTTLDRYNNRKMSEGDDNDNNIPNLFDKKISTYSKIETLIK
uniref:Anoctamin n=1 Tax=Strongyloides venezuelensis TaxID=75913 RepID=A0A0K0FNW4_STRVS